MVAMGSERRKNKSTTMKRTPLSNVTNSLIPHLSSTNKPQIPNSSLKSNPKSLNPFQLRSSNSNNVPSSSIRRDHSPPVPQPPFSPSLYYRDGSGPPVIYSGTQTTTKSKKSKGFCSAVPYPHSSLETKRGKEEEVTLARGYTLVETENDKGKGNFVPLSSLSSVKTKTKGKALEPGCHNLEENEERGSMVVREAHSCPSQRISRNNRKQINEAGDSLQSKLNTDPRPTKKKRLRLSQEDDIKPILPREFVEQQKAYFKEVDDFELLEEEVSNEWLDEEEKPNS